jgi:Stage II sporulation protein E (SpoIIE)
MPALKPRRLTTLDFAPRAVLCLYTDGLVERRDQPIDHGIAGCAPPSPPPIPRLAAPR